MTLNQDKWIGIGGKFEDKESPEDCLLRECREETGLTLTDYRYRGLVTFMNTRVAHGVYAPVHRYRLDRRTTRSAMRGIWRGFQKGGIC